MRVEDTRGGCMSQFPVGMRVLAVDDDLACLRLLEALLRRCRYHVTITDRATMALELLRENRDSFDLVISDVHMPDMDGFKLLELVGLEMDLPVIMLSGDGDTKTVMKGITHGAVDYLLKPVRIEELKNIWQHAIRRRKLDMGCETRGNGDFEEGDGPDGVSNGPGERNGKLSRKRKGHLEEDGDYCEEGMNESEDPSTQKRPRVVWSIELHRKFVSAINHLGLEKAVPKRILDLMNVDGLTRENVASHLQKYRLYLRRLNVVARQQASMVAALGGRDLPYIPMYSADSFGDFRGRTASDHTPPLSPYKPNGVLNPTSLSTFGLQMLGRSGLVQFGDDHNTTSPIKIDLHKPQYNSLPVNNHGNLIQMRALPVELENFQQSKAIPVNNPLPVSPSECGVITDSSISSFVGIKDIPLLLQANPQYTQHGKLSTDSSLGLQSMTSDLFENSARNRPYSSNLGRCNGTWQVAVHLDDYTAKISPLSAPSTRNDVSFSMTGAYSSPISSNISSSISIVAPHHDPTVARDGQCQSSSGRRDSVLMSTSINEDPKFLNFRNSCNSRQKWEKPKMIHATEPGLLLGSSLNSSLSRHPFFDSLPENERLGNRLYSMKTNTSIVGPTDHSAPLLTRSFNADKSIFDGHQNYKDEFSPESSKLIGRNSNYCNFDDLVKAMIKKEQDNVDFIDDRVGYDADTGYDIFPLGTCM